MVSYEGALVDFEVGSRAAIDKVRSLTQAEIVPVNVTPIYSTAACVAEIPMIETVPRVPLDYVNSMSGVLIQIESVPFDHVKPDYFRSFGGVLTLLLYGLPASEFGYVRAITIIHKGRPVPFMTTVLDAALPTGLITSSVGKSSTVLQKLKYVARGRRSHEEYESDELDLSGAVPPEVEVTVRRKTSAKFNRKKMR